MTLAAFLRDMFPPPPKPREDPSKSPGIWYRDGDIPH